MKITPKMKNLRSEVQTPMQANLPAVISPPVEGDPSVLHAGLVNSPIKYAKWV